MGKGRKLRQELTAECHSWIVQILCLFPRGPRQLPSLDTSLLLASPSPALGAFLTAGARWVLAGPRPDFKNSKEDNTAFSKSNFPQNAGFQPLLLFMKKNGASFTSLGPPATCPALFHPPLPDHTPHHSMSPHTVSFSLLCQQRVKGSGLSPHNVVSPALGQRLSSPGVHWAGPVAERYCVQLFSQA